MDAKGNPIMKLNLPNQLEVTNMTLVFQKILKTKPQVTIVPFRTFGHISGFRSCEIKFDTTKNLQTMGHQLINYMSRARTHKDLFPDEKAF